LQHLHQQLEGYLVLTKTTSIWTTTAERSWIQFKIIILMLCSLMSNQSSKNKVGLIKPYNHNLKVSKMQLYLKGPRILCTTPE